MAIYRWPGGFDPFVGLRYVQREMERLLGRMAGESQRIGGGAYPPVNVLNGSNDMIVQCEMAGVKKDEVDLSITGDTLVIKGTKHAPANEEKMDYQRRERGYGDFSRTIVLPDRVEADRVEAKLEAGILTVRLPKSDAAKPKQIKLA